METTKRDNYVWVRLRDDFNHSKDGEILSYNGWTDDDKPRYLTVLIKLGYIKRTLLYSRCTQPGSYSKVKLIPTDLRWMDAQKEAKSLNISLKKQIRKYTLWNHVVEKINNHDKDTFNANNMFPYEKYNTGPDLYISKIYKLGYIDRLDKKRNYKIVEKIPEKLTATLASKFLYDKIYKRLRKIEKLKEKLNDNPRDI
jgi:hypothetical protein